MLSILFLCLFLSQINLCCCLRPNLGLFLAKVIERGTDNLRGAGFADIYNQQCFKDQFTDEFYTGYNLIDENDEWKARWAALYPLYSVEEKLT